MDLTKEAIEKILELSEVETLDLNDGLYTSKKVYPVLAPVPDGLTLNTLTGIADYLNENPDGLDLDQVMIHVLSAVEVRVFSRLFGFFEQRSPYVKALHQMPEFEFGRYMDLETFVIEMQAKFVQDDATAEILQLMGTVTDDLVRVYADDGVTQEVTAKSSVGRVENRAVPNPVALRPYRSFLEVEQPLGRFVLRMKSGSSTNTGKPMVALFNADGGAWQLDAIGKVRAWLREQIPDNVVVVA